MSLIHVLQSSSTGPYALPSCAILFPGLTLVGEVIGINTMKALGMDGIAFAVPIDEVKRIVAQLQAYGRVLRPYLGLKVRASVGLRCSSFICMCATWEHTPTAMSHQRTNPAIIVPSRSHSHPQSGHTFKIRAQPKITAPTHNENAKPQ